jgi:glyoxylase-like metal-dependent hydrolase (beta-lactamase superfamily II)
LTELDVATIDCDYLQPRFAASFLIAAAGEAAVIETGTARSVPRILAELASHALQPAQVRWVVVTHAHLDHAAGAAALLSACPGATLVAHPKAARHLIDPTRLVRAVQAVYGEAEFHKLYGKVDPIDPARVLAVEEGQEVPFGRGALRVLHTRGHANHHLCLFDRLRGAVFTGDSFGLAYPKLQKKGLFIIPSTSPTEFDPQAARESVRRIAGLGARRAFLTHYGPISSIAAAAEQLLEHLDASERVLLWVKRQLELRDAREVGPKSLKERQEVDTRRLVEHCEQDLRQYYRDYLERKKLEPGPTGSVQYRAFWELLSLDLKLNAQGIVAAALAALKKSAVPPDSASSSFSG